MLRPVMRPAAPAVALSPRIIVASADGAIDQGIVFEKLELVD